VIAEWCWLQTFEESILCVALGRHDGVLTRIERDETSDILDDGSRRGSGMRVDITE
jgi:hypothetical protein